MNQVLKFFLLLTVLLAASCQQSEVETPTEETADQPYIAVLGIAQDAGFPQTACVKQCCAEAWKNPAARRMVSCLGLVNPSTGERWLFDATPDFRDQLALLNELAGKAGDEMPDGIFLTHAHIGHYTGLMQLGREVTGASEVPVYAMPRMKNFLETNGPWSQLVSLNQIKLMPLRNDSAIDLGAELSVTPFEVPHRDEFSETVGFEISGPDGQAIFIPDIDKWDKWERNIGAFIDQQDIAFLDATFCTADELPGRDMSEIPHPFAVETAAHFQDRVDREKIVFIHLNHSNPLLRDTQERTEMEEMGFRIAEQGQRYPL